MSDEPPAEHIAPAPLPPPLPPRGHPLLATLAGSLLILLLLAAPEEAAAPKYDLAGKLGALLGHVIFALVVWAALYAITIRRASRRWKIGSLAVLIALGLLNGLISIGRSDDER